MPTTVSEEELSLRGAGRYIWVRIVVRPSYETIVRGANIIVGKVGVDVSCHRRVSRFVDS